MISNAHIRAAFGFLGGKEVREAGVGNLGLHDRELNSVTPKPLAYFLRHAQSVRLCDGFRTTSPSLAVIQRK